MTDAIIGIVIPYYNDREPVIRCLQSVKEAVEHLTHGFQKPHVVVVDDHSPEPFDPILSPVPVTSIRLPVNSSVGAARNRGAEMCRGTHILFLDSDVRLERYHLTRLYQHLDCDKTRIVQGPTSTIPANTNASLFQHYLAAAWNYYEQENWRVSVFTQCFLIEKRFFLDIGGFSEDYARSGGEEFELGLRLNCMEPGLIAFDEQLGHDHHFDGLVKRMKKAYLRSRHIGSIALRMPNLPFRFTAQVMMRSACAFILNASILLALVKPHLGIPAYAVAVAMLYVCDDPFTQAMKKAHSRKLALLSVVFRQIEFTAINLGMARGFWDRTLNRIVKKGKA